MYRTNIVLQYSVKTVKSWEHTDIPEAYTSLLQQEVAYLTECTAVAPQANCCSRVLMSGLFR